MNKKYCNLQDILNYCSKDPVKYWLMLVLFLIIVGGLIDYWDLTTQKNGDLYFDFKNILFFISGAATATIAFIAFQQLSFISKINKNKHLMQIDQRWGDPQMIKARQIIHLLYREVCDEVGYEEENNKTLIKDIYPILGHIIVEISVHKNNKIRSMFPYLLNYLDFMESIAHIYKNCNKEDFDELEALIGETLLFNYGVFCKYIKFRNLKHKDHSSEFYDLFVELIKRKNNNKKTKIDKCYSFQGDSPEIIKEKLKLVDKIIKKLIANPPAF